MESLTPPVYPSTRTKVHSGQLPNDKLWHVKGGTPLNVANRDNRFPLIWAVQSHPFTPSKYTTWVIIMDTSEEARRERSKFEAELTTPLGPDRFMDHYGLIRVKPGTVVYARSLVGPVDAEGYRTADEDVLIAAAGDGYTMLDPEMVEEMLELREDVLGSEDFIADPMSNDNGKTQFAPTYFETLGQNSIKSSRCYSLTMTHQRPRGIVGPTAGGKVYEDEGLMENIELRKRIIELNTKAAMIVLKELAPKADLAMLDANSQCNNLPHIGTDDNTAFPALQANLAKAIAFLNCLVSGLKEMGEFGGIHRDKYDDAAAKTAMVVNSRLPPDYEVGRFHLLELGLYFVLEHLLVPIFCGLALHVGTPPIAPPGQEPLNHAVRFMTVLYPPSSMLSETSEKTVPFASLPNGKLLTLGPEITSYRGLELQQYSNEANWAQDGHVLMQPFSHFNFFIRGLLQLCSYLVQQLPTAYRITINSDLFLSAFTMDGENGERLQATPWPEAPDGSAYDTNAEPSDADNFSHATVPTLRGQQLGLQTGRVNAIVLKRQMALQWIERQEKFYEFLPIAVEDAPTWEYMRNKIILGPHGARQIKSAKAVKEKRVRTEDKGKKTAKRGNNPISMAPAIGKHMLQAMQHHQNEYAIINSVHEDFRQSKRIRLAADMQTNPNAASSSTQSTDLVASSSRCMRLRSHTFRGDPTGTAGIDADMDAENSEDSEDNSEAASMYESNGDHVNEQIIDLIDILNLNNTTNDSGERECNEENMDEDSEEDIFSKYGISADENKDSIAQFLEKLNYNSILVPLMEFDIAIKARWQIKNPRSHSGILCGEMIGALEKRSEDVDTAVALPYFWKMFDEFEQYAVLQAVESRISRSLLMHSSCRAYMWVITIATNAVKQPTGETSLWFNDLARDVEKHSNRTITDVNAPKEVTISSEQYLPSLLPPRKATVKLLRWTYNEEKQKLQTIRTISSIIETWLEFPSRHQKVRSLLVHFMTKNMPLSVLLLDEVWMMFQKPYGVIHGQSNQRIRDKHTKQTLEKFEKAIQKHDLANPNSKESQLLAALDEQSQAWYQLVTSKGPKTVDQVMTLPAGVHADVTTTKMSILLNYLRQLRPLLEEGVTTCLNSRDHLVKRIARRPDFLLPFRQKAPMINKAMQTIYSSSDRLRTSEGFWNILAYRGVFYGSMYAANDVQWFNSLEDWKSYFQLSTKRKEESLKGKKENTTKKMGDKEAYYVNICAYGYNNIKRTIDNIPTYWAERDRWTVFLETKPGIEEVYRFLLKTHARKDGVKKVYPNIGPLTALLICGDLIEAGVLQMPNVDIWARLIFQVNKGAIAGLQQLALLDNTCTEPDVVQVFQALHDFIMRNLSEEEQLMMGYNMIMLEHALCKFSRITKKIGKKEKETGKKRKSNRMTI